MPEPGDSPRGLPDRDAEAQLIARLERRFATAGLNPATRALLHAMIIHRLQQAEARRQSCPEEAPEGAAQGAAQTAREAVGKAGGAA